MKNGQTSVPTVPLDALFIAFLKVAFCGLGGGVVWARRIAVEQRRWINEEEFADILSLCQFMPGPNVVGIAVCVGAKVRGLAGAIAAAGGFVFIPLAIGFLFGVFYLEYAHLPVLQKILAGVSSAAAGLLIATTRARRSLRSIRRSSISSAMLDSGLPALPPGNTKASGLRVGAQLRHLAQHVQRGLRQRDAMLPRRLHAVGRNRPDRLVHVDFRPPRADHLARARRRQDREPQRQRRHAFFLGQRPP